MIKHFFSNGNFLEKFFLHIPTKDIHLIYGTIESLLKNVIFDVLRTNSQEKWQSKLVFQDNFHFDEMKSTSPPQLYNQFLLVRDEVLHEVFLQRFFVLQAYWKFYPEVSKPQTSIDLVFEKEEEEDQLASQQIVEDNIAMQKEYEKQQEELMKQMSQISQFSCIVNHLQHISEKTRFEFEREAKEKEKQTIIQKKTVKPKKAFNSLILKDNTCDMLRSKCEKLRFPTSGKKEDLMKRLCPYCQLQNGKIQKFVLPEIDFQKTYQQFQEEQISKQTSETNKK